MTVGTIGYDDQTVSDNAKTWGSKGSLLGFIGGALTDLLIDQPREGVRRPARP